MIPADNAQNNDGDKQKANVLLSLCFSNKNIYNLN